MITEDYSPDVYSLNAARTYAITFPSVGAEAIFVYEVSSAPYRRVRVRKQDYDISFASHPRDPLKYRGEVRFLRPHLEGTIRVEILRNTFMDQVVDFAQVSAFNTRMLEFALDKLTMIAQEIASRKCGAQVSTPIRQPFTFGSYWVITPNLVNRALNRITQILFEIDQSGTDCRMNLAPPDESDVGINVPPEGGGSLVVSPNHPDGSQTLNVSPWVPTP